MAYFRGYLDLSIKMGHVNLQKPDKTNVLTAFIDNDVNFDSIIIII